MVTWTISDLGQSFINIDQVAYSASKISPQFFVAHRKILGEERWKFA